MRNSGIVLYVLLIVLFNTFSATAQKKSMFCSLTWEQAAELAQKENKVYFGGCHAETRYGRGAETKR